MGFPIDQPRVTVTSDISKDYVWQNWWSFVNHIQSIDTFDYIFRGQSNYYKVPVGQTFRPWTVVSAFNRSCTNFNFLESKASDIAALSIGLKAYRANCINFDPNAINFIDFVQFLQHYISSTPLIDFTKDPLTALYFAVANIPSELKLSIKSVEDYQNENRYISIFQIDTSKLSRLKIVDINEDDIFLNKFKDKALLVGLEQAENIFQSNPFKKFLKEYKNNKHNIFTIMHPNGEINPNLGLQEGLFVYLDSPKHDLESTLKRLAKDHQVKVPALFIHHKILYKSCLRLSFNECINVYAYLMRKNKIGVNLFENDKEGLKLDLYNGDLVDTLKCLHKQDYNNCDCMKNLRGLVNL